jgi:NAD-dependent SIR2 family protein deacetylase
MANLAKTAAGAQPTAFHKLLKELLCRGILGRTYTQNIDNLELKAGLEGVGEEPNCVQLHGSLMEVQCTQCAFTEHTHHHFSALSSGRLPPCPKCEMWIEKRKSEGKRGTRCGILRPAIILYGEQHPKSDDITKMQVCDESEADNLLVVGTSLSTFGAVNLIKNLSNSIRQRGGGVYYMDIASPPAKLVPFFDDVLQADCQEFANYMLNHLKVADEYTGSASVDFDRKIEDLGEAGRVRKDMRPSWDWA